MTKKAQPETPYEYPDDAAGSCLVVGIPPADRPDEAIPVDLVRALLCAVKETRENVQRSDPQAILRVEVFGSVPRMLTRPDLIIADALSPSSDDQEIFVLKETEFARASILKAIVREFSIDDVEVLSMSQMLKEDSDLQRGFVDSINAAKGYLDNNEKFEIDYGSEGKKKLALRDSLEELIPLEIKRRKNEREIKGEINYALAEMLLIIRKVTKGIVLVLAQRELKYLAVARAYMTMAQHLDSGLINKYVFMPPYIDGLILPPDMSKIKNPRGIRLGRAPAYRVRGGEEGRRVLVYPADSLDGMKRKLYREDIPESDRVRIEREYIQQMIIPTLRMLRVVIESVQRSRREFEKVLPNGTLNDEAELLKDPARILEAFYGLVLAPVNAAIEDALRKNASRPTTPVPGTPAPPEGPES